MKFAHWLVLTLACVALVFANQAVARDLPSTPEGTVQAVSQSLADGQPQILWSALPAKYQADVKDLLSAYAAKMDKDMYDKSFALFNKFVKVLKDKKDFILNLPMIQGIIAPKKTELTNNWGNITGMLDTVGTSEIKSVDGLKNLDVEKFLATTGAQLMKQGKDLAALAPEGAEKAKMMGQLAKLKETKATVVSSDSDKATLKIEVPGEAPKEVVFKNVDGKWLPADLVDGWDKGIAKAKEDISKLDMNSAKMQVMPMMSMIDTVLDQLLKANTQEEFNMTVMQVAAMFGGAGGPGGAGGAGGPGGPGGPGQ